MKALHDDTFARKPQGYRRRRSSGVLIFSLATLSVALLVLSRIDAPLVTVARRSLAELVGPVLDRVTTNLAPIRALRERYAAMTVAADELERLKAENQRLAGWEARAQELERRIADLQALARVVDEPAIKYVTGRVVADAGGPFARSVLLNAGRDEGLRGGYPVISADGVVGRVLETGPQFSRVLLLTDLNSRIPVLVGNDDAKAILLGDNGPVARLAHVAPSVLIKSGDRVVTSGVGGLFPRGLRVGTVVETPAGMTVEPFARLDNLDYVSVLFYQSPALDLVREDARPPAQTGRRRTLAGDPVPPEPSTPTTQR